MRNTGGYMDTRDIKRLAFDIAKARILLNTGDTEGVEMLLDDAAGIFELTDWPKDEELALT
jgi:hypothetical protein